MHYEEKDKLRISLQVFQKSDPSISFFWWNRIFQLSYFQSFRQGFAYCSFIILHGFSFRCNMCHTNAFYGFNFSLVQARTDSFINPFFNSTAELWNNLSVFPDGYNLQIFQTRTQTLFF